MIFLETKATIMGIATEVAGAVMKANLFSGKCSALNSAKISLQGQLATYINLALNVGLRELRGVYRPYASTLFYDGSEATSATSVQPVDEAAFVDVITRALLPVGAAIDSQTTGTARFAYSGGIYRTTHLQNGRAVIWATAGNVTEDKEYSDLDHSMMESLAGEALVAMAKPEVILSTCWNRQIQMEPTSRKIARALILTELTREADAAWYCEEGIKVLRELSQKPADSLDDYYDEQSRFMFSSTPDKVHAWCAPGGDVIVWDAYKVPHVIK